MAAENGVNADLRGVSGRPGAGAGAQGRGAAMTDQDWVREQLDEWNGVRETVNARFAKINREQRRRDHVAQLNRPGAAHDLRRDAGRADGAG